MNWKAGDHALIIPPAGAALPPYFAEWVGREVILVRSQREFIATMGYCTTWDLTFVGPTPISGGSYPFAAEQFLAPIPPPEKCAIPAEVREIFEREKATT